MGADGRAGDRRESAVSLRARIARGEISAGSVLEQYLRVIEEREREVQAWAWCDAESARARAGALTPLGAADLKRYPLHGLPVGLKDIVDTADMPTENGTVLHAGRRPAKDAALVARLRDAGAVIMGKTVTTELATYAPGKTRNPHALAHTPGGSSSGSAAAVACGMVPLAIGTQTNGSTIRPGGFCGVVSFKPTRASIDRTGVLVQSPSFDTVGLFARTVEDVELLWRVLSAPLGTGVNMEGEATDRYTAPALRSLVWMPGPLVSRLEAGTEDLLKARALQWGAQPWPEDVPCGMAAVIELHRLVMEAEIARHFEGEYARGAMQLSASLRGQIERGRMTSDGQLAHYQAQLRELQQQVDDWMQSQQIDAWITASAPGPAPVGLGSTGDPIFCTLATALDLPALQLPGLRAPNGLPLGTQVVARRGADAALLALGARLFQP